MTLETSSEVLAPLHQRTQTLVLRSGDGPRKPGAYTQAMIDLVGRLGGELYREALGAATDRAPGLNEGAVEYATRQGVEMPTEPLDLSTTVDYVPWRRLHAQYLRLVELPILWTIVNRVDRDSRQESHQGRGLAGLSPPSDLLRAYLAESVLINAITRPRDFPTTGRTFPLATFVTASEVADYAAQYYMLEPADLAAGFSDARLRRVSFGAVLAAKMRAQKRLGKNLVDDTSEQP